MIKNATRSELAQERTFAVLMVNTRKDVETLSSKCEHAYNMKLDAIQLIEKPPQASPETERGNVQIVRPKIGRKSHGTISK